MVKGPPEIETPLIAIRWISTGNVVVWMTAQNIHQEGAVRDCIAVNLDKYIDTIRFGSRSLLITLVIFWYGLFMAFY